jgi:hypothetical protein
MNPDVHSRWKAALSAAARQTLAARWRSTVHALRVAELDYRALYSADEVDIQALRKAAQRIHDLKQLRAVLAGEMTGKSA